MRVVLCAAILVLSVGCGAKKGDPTGEPAARGGIPDDWTHKELLDHLNKKGLKLRMYPTDFGSFFGPSAFLVRDGAPIQDERAAKQAYDAKAADVVYCTLRKTPQAAKDEVGAKANALAAGRFVFEGRPAELDRIRAALPTG